MISFRKILKFLFFVLSDLLQVDPAALCNSGFINFIMGPLEGAEHGPFLQGQTPGLLGKDPCMFSPGPTGPTPGQSNVSEILKIVQNDKKHTSHTELENLTPKSNTVPPHAHTHAREPLTNSIHVHQGHHHNGSFDLWNPHNPQFLPGSYIFSDHKNSSSPKTPIDLSPEGNTQHHHKNSSEPQGQSTPSHVHSTISHGHSTASQGHIQRNSTPSPAAIAEIRRSMLSGCVPIKRRPDSVSSADSTGSPAMSVASASSDLDPPPKKKSNRGRKPGQCKY